VIPPRFPNEDTPSGIRAAAMYVAIVLGFVAFAASAAYLAGGMVPLLKCVGVI
jgi:hypothetical protein